MLDSDPSKGLIGQNGRRIKQKGEGVQSLSASRQAVTMNPVCATMR